MDEYSAMDPVERDFRRELEAVKRSGLTVSQHLIQLSRRGDWLAIDNLLRFVNEDEFDLDAVAQGTGWSPLMFAAKENRVNIVERLLDIGFDVNAQAAVR
jgi:ankyrin repeat protein